MPLNPFVEGFLASPVAKTLMELLELSPAEARPRLAEMGKFMPKGPEVARVNDLFIEGPLGDIPIRCYWPEGRGPFPIYVFFHGGGFTVGNLNSMDWECRGLAMAIGCLVVSVDYRHAPEFKFPAAPEDAYAAVQWVAAHAAELQGDPDRLVVGGVSAGANLAAVVALMARDRGTPAIRFQVLVVPVTSTDVDTPSSREYGEGFGLSRKMMEKTWVHYLNDPQEGQNPYVSPLLAPSLAGLPPTFILTAEFDPLRDSGQAYAERLRREGVQVAYQCNPGMVHFMPSLACAQEIALQLRPAFES